jgi:hypothetical protein
MASRTYNNLAKNLTAEDMRGIEDHGPRQIEVFIDNGEGRANDEATGALLKKVSQLVPWGGYTTGYGGIILRKNYVSKGEWNDRCSAHHY